MFPESDDDRVFDAALVLAESGLLRPVLVGEESKLRERLEAEGAADLVDLADPASSEHRESIVDALFELRRERGMTPAEAAVLAFDGLRFAAGLVGLGHADACVAGARHTTAEVIRSGLQHVGLAEGTRVVSGAFLMVAPGGSELPGPLYFADSAVLPAPTEDELVDVGRSSARLFESLVGEPARIACLSFSTKGSAEHPAATKMAAVALRLAAEGLSADGELQLDAAILPAVARRKVSDSPVAGEANVLLFPDLGAGNIGYKLAERLGGYRALGPILQGFRRPFYDLSRGCSAEDVVNIACVAALEAKGLNET